MSTSNSSQQLDFSTWPPPPGGETKSKPETRKTNLLGGFALVLAIVGAVFACIEGVMIVGWFLLPLAVIFGVAALSKPGKKKVTALVGILVSILGIVLSYGVFSNLSRKSMDAAYGTFFESHDRSESLVADKSDTERNEDELTEPKPAEDLQDSFESNGTRENPIAIGETAGNYDWDVRVNSFTPNADAQVAEASVSNEPAENGFQYVVVNMTLTYKGDDSEFAQLWPVAFVADDGSVYHWFDRVITAPEPELEGEMYAGAAVTGNVALHIPIDKPGVLRINLENSRDEVFVAVP